MTPDKFKNRSSLGTIMASTLAAAFAAMGPMDRYREDLAFARRGPAVGDRGVDRPYLHPTKGWRGKGTKDRGANRRRYRPQEN